MASRRKFLQSSITLSALAASEQSVMAAVFARKGDGVTIVGECVVDKRFSESQVLAHPHIAPYLVQGARYLETAGDVTELWMTKLSRDWKEAPRVIAGLTGEDSLFVLESLAFDHDMRVIHRHSLDIYSAEDADKINPLLSWIIAPRSEARLA